MYEHLNVYENKINMRCFLIRISVCVCAVGSSEHGLDYIVALCNDAIMSIKAIGITLQQQQKIRIITTRNMKEEEVAEQVAKHKERISDDVHIVQ